MAETILTWLSTYGYLALFGLQAVGILGLPVPEEVLLAAAGMLAAQGKLGLAGALMAAALGSWCGITVSYILGRTLGNLLLEKMVKHERIFHISPVTLDAIRRKFHRFGGWMLLFGYFLPGIRHITAVSAGTMNFRYPAFALFAYTGGLAWSMTFVTLGYILGEEWFKMSSHVRHGLLIASGGVAVVLMFIYIVSRLAYGSKWEHPM